jgi:glucose-1-phosphate thymidylyltransferase
MFCKTAVILARGLGTRLKKKTKNLKLDQATEDFANKGWKPFIPLIGSRSFLDYTIASLQQVGIAKVCLVIGPEHSPIRKRYEKMDKSLSNLEICFAIQKKPLGTADAVKAAKDWLKNESFIVLNGDNLYPPSNIKTLIFEPEKICYIVGFNRESLIKKSNFSAERIKNFSVIETTETSYMERIVEKPSNPETYSTPQGILVNMNLYRFTYHIFQACEKIKPSPSRGEYELTSAVQMLIDELTVPIKVLVSNEGVIDLTYRKDIPKIKEKLEALNIRF